MRELLILTVLFALADSTLAQTVRGTGTPPRPLGNGGSSATAPFERLTFESLGVARSNGFNRHQGVPLITCLTTHESGTI